MRVVLVALANFSVLLPTLAVAVDLQRPVRLATPVDTCAWAQGVVSSEMGRGGDRLAGYDRFGHFCVGVAGTGLRQIESDARDFLWSHWVAHERGVAILTLHSIQGLPSTSFMYVEPSE